MANLFCVYDTFTGDLVFHNSEDEALEDFNCVVDIFESVEAKGHEVYIYEVKKKMKYV
jgi:hypothetical protein